MVLKIFFDFRVNFFYVSVQAYKLFINFNACI